MFIIVLSLSLQRAFDVSPTEIDGRALAQSILVDARGISRNRADSQRSQEQRSWISLQLAFSQR